ncbi:MAG: DUF2169 domain-containing protein, partial [Sandaracinaceae bacterium]|nr:DUF2169 domain-containing protein [Sandaracinaceae bacterium]
AVLPRARRWEVAVVVRSASETLLRHELVATGPRAWEHRGALRGWTLTDPEPTTELSIRYELAYGGAYRDRKNSGAWIVHEPNPSGIGFADEAALDRDRPHPAPQWELPDHPITALNHDVPLAGLGPIARPWLSRRRLAGTYDEAWERRVREEREHGLPPDYAPDFDPRFFQCAHPSLITREHLEGDESVGLAGLWPRGSSLLTRLPGLRVWASTCTREMVWTERRLPLDTVHIDLDAARVYLAWRLSLDQEQDVRAAVLYTEEGRST